MYKPTEPIRCPKCGAIVKVDLYKILTSNPPCYEWTCPNCGEKGCTKQGDIITFENQIGGGTSGYIQKVDEPDPGVGVTTTNADDIKTINIIPAIYSTNTRCIICDEEFHYDGEHRICPKCREAIIKLRGAVESIAKHTPSGQYTNPNPSTTISLGDKPKVPNSCTIAYATPCDNIKATL